MRIFSVAFGLIAAFWSASAQAELAGSAEQAAWLQSHSKTISTNREASPPRVPRQLRDGRVILLGEIHGLAHGQQADFALLKALHRQAGVRHYLGEFDAAQADAFNSLLDNGDTAPLDAVFDGWRTRGLQWANADFRDKLIAIAAWNRTLPRRQKIRFLGADEIQDRPAYCRWLHARMAHSQLGAELQTLRTALGDPARCGEAGSLAQAALSSAKNLDAVTSNGIAALAVDASIADREARISANVERYLARHRGRAYGLWGLYHVVQAEVNGTSPLALQLARKGVPVRSIALLNLGGEMMIPAPGPDGSITYAKMRYTVDSEEAALVNGIEAFAAASSAPLTLFALTGSKSPFRNSDALTRVGGRFGEMQPFTIDPTTAPRGFWTDGVMISRGSPATKPLE